jgi:predicted secreted protein
MTWLQAILVYAVCWWLLLFMALPIGIEQEKNPEPGHSTAAPRNPKLLTKCAVVTVLAVLVTWCINLLLHSGLITVR